MSQSLFKNCTLSTTKLQQRMILSRKKSIVGVTSTFTLSTLAACSSTLISAFQVHHNVGHNRFIKSHTSDINLRFTNYYDAFSTMKLRNDYFATFSSTGEIDKIDNSDLDDEIGFQDPDSLDIIQEVQVEPIDTAKSRKKQGGFRKRGEKPRDMGKNDNFAIIDHFNVPDDGFACNDIFQALLADKLKANNTRPGTEEIASGSGVVNSRSKLLELRNDNVTLPIALLSLRNEEYPSMSRARKACR